jgi:alkylation response protein AidB-like acyl-CoA dehydrogenase
MEFSLSEDQQLLKDSIARFVEREYPFEQRQKLIMQGGGFSAANWRTFADMGWLMLGLPTDKGGLGGSAVDTAIIMEEFGKALVVEPFVPVAISAARILIEANESGGLIEAIGSGGAMPVFAHSEAEAYGVLHWVACTAARSGGAWRLNGRKSLVSAGPFASHFIISARTSGATGDADGISLFLVAPDAQGLVRHDGRLADSSRASELTLTDCPATLLGPENAALPLIETCHAHTTIALCAEAVGAMDTALWTTRNYLQTRQQFGAAIGTFQSLQHRMADMLIELEMARSQVYRALAHLDADAATRDRAVSSMKVQIGRSAKFIGAQAVQLHGGMGMTEEYRIGHFFRRLFMIESACGTTGVHLGRMARLDRPTLAQKAA